MKMLIWLSLFSLFVAQSHQQQNTQYSSSQPFNIKEFIQTNFNEYFYESTLVVLVIIYAINYVLGKNLNKKHALRWVEQNKAIFESEFKHVGVSNIPNADLLESETPNVFKFYASGRPNCVYSLTTMEFKKRQDLFSMVVLNLFNSQKDRIRIEIPIETPLSLPFIFTIVKKKQAKLVQKNYPEIQHFCKKMSLDELHQDYSIFAENEQVSDYILSNNVISTLKLHETAIEMISISDQKKPYKQFLKADLMMPTRYLKNPAEFHNIIKTLFYLADHIAAYKMSNTDRTKAEKERKVYEEKQAKEERRGKQSEAQRKLQEKKREESSSKKTDQKDDSKKKMQKKIIKTN